MPPHNIQKRASLGIKPVQQNNNQNKTDNQQRRQPLFKLEKNRKVNPTELSAQVYLPGVFSLNQITLNVGK